MFYFLLRASWTDCGMMRMPTYQAVLRGGRTKQLGISRLGAVHTQRGFHGLSIDGDKLVNRSNSLNFFLVSELLGFRVSHGFLRSV